MTRRKVVINVSRPQRKDKNLFQNNDLWSKIDAEYSVVMCKTEDELISNFQDADAVITNEEPPNVTQRVIASLKKCRLIHNTATGYENIDVKAAIECGICVSNAGDYSIEEVSDHVMALLLACARKVVRLDRAIREGQRLEEMEEFLSPMLPLNEQTLGIIGLGKIGRCIIPKAKGLGLRVIAFDSYLAPEIFRELGVESVTLDELLRQSDFVSLNAPLTATTHHLIGMEQLKVMKPMAYLINCARGEIVDEKALYNTLSEGYIAGAGLDVVTDEPIDADNPLLKLENVVITPHIGYYSDAMFPKQLQIIFEHLEQIFNEKWPTWLVNPEVKEKYLQRWRKAPSK